jgi:SAM-dependent methyltransferase
VTGREGIAGPEDGANYAYWRDHGGEWGEEYHARKRRQVYYHVQELMLADYFSRSAPARILEFGCGTGRHLSYLSRLRASKRTDTTRAPPWSPMLSSGRIETGSTST